MMHPGFGVLVTAGVLHGLLLLALLVLIVVLIIWFIRHMTPASARRDTAEQDLRRRYAAGEVGREEYLTRIADLRGRSQPPPSSSSQ